MWRGATIFLLFSLSINRISGKFFSEAGSYHLPDDEQPSSQNGLGGDPASAQYYDLDQLYPYQQPPYPGNDNEKLAGIVDELQKVQNIDLPNDDANFQAYPENQFYDSNEKPNNENLDLDALTNLKDNTKPEAKEAEKEKPDEVVEPKQQPLTAQKKGQSEFVGFVEPIQKSSNQLKDVEFMDKRVPVDSYNGGGQPVRVLQSSGNVVFIALITMCCVVSIVGVVGGAYYYNNARKANENTFDDFTRYSPAGPGRDKKQKKGRSGSGGSNITENGDESLAYKAQLHHYQQTKQKIIGAEEGMAGIPGVEEDDKSDDELEEHNFSVYECPGLAPTGDIEVQNPNFDIKHHNVTP